MKKILFAIAIVLTFGLTANAQGRDGFFSNYDNGYGDRTGNNVEIVAPNHGINGYASGNGVEAPLGSGLLVLTALGAGYAVARRRQK
ncbi:MAG: hypothetical protein IKS65_05160 [Bacteroidales bacterium]|nr:hypothetical protein [Bacteroidales bacterium]